MNIEHCGKPVLSKLLNSMEQIATLLDLDNPTPEQVVEAVRERVTWRPIEESPKDGTPVRLYRPPPRAGQWDQSVTAVWTAENGWVWPDSQQNDGWWGEEFLNDLIEDDDFFCSRTGFTHFMLLPKPPKTSLKGN